MCKTHTQEDPMVLGCSLLSVVSGRQGQGWWVALSLWLPLTSAPEASIHAGAPPDQALRLLCQPRDSLRNVPLPLFWTGAWSSDQLLWRAGKEA